MYLYLYYNIYEQDDAAALAAKVYHPLFSICACMLLTWLHRLPRRKQKPMLPMRMEERSDLLWEYTSLVICVLSIPIIEAY